MTILPPTTGLNRSHLADWLELRALSSASGVSSSRDLLRVTEANSDGEEHGVINDAVTGEALPPCYSELQEYDSGLDFDCVGPARFRPAHKAKS
jgi:hypothetical protein